MKKIGKKTAGKTFKSGGGVKTFSAPLGRRRSFGAWAVQDEKDQEAKAEAHKLAYNRKRPPETWVGEGETKYFWFVTPKPLFMPDMYRAKVFGRFQRITVPDGEDLFAGTLRSTPFAIYEVIDVEGYVEKKTGKQHKNIYRFFVATMKQHEFIQDIGVEDLERYCIKVRRGTGQPVQYSFMPDTKTYTERPDLSKIKVPTDEEIEEYYRPPTLEEQETMLAGVEPTSFD